MIDLLLHKIDTVLTNFLEILTNFLRKILVLDWFSVELTITFVVRYHKHFYVKSVYLRNLQTFFYSVFSLLCCLKKLSLLWWKLSQGFCKSWECLFWHFLKEEDGFGLDVYYNVDSAQSNSLKLHKWDPYFDLMCSILESGEAQILFETKMEELTRNYLLWKMQGTKILGKFLLF